MQSSFSETPVAEVIAENIRGQRGRMRLSQGRVAARMKALGFKWHYQTVGAIERGDRSLYAEEMVALALALQTTVPLLLQPVTPAVTLPSGHRVSAERVFKIDASIDWDGDRPMTGVANARSPVELRADVLRDRADFLENYRDTLKNRTETRQPAPGADPSEDAIDIPPRRRGRPRKGEDQR